ncbi:MAG: hypothetical protein NXI01_05060 [Gammaproteobacteria bacterium]|nr:hypothetical protein [Gammaproteobacteria bacterium]
MSLLLSQLTAFGMTISLIWEKIAIPDTKETTHHCDAEQFYLAIPGTARFLVLPKENCIIIERSQAETSIHVLNNWLKGTVMAYILQYHGYLVLHGSAVLIKDSAVIFSGQSGAGKSTLANAFLQKRYPCITDDLVVLKQNAKGQYCIIPGPTQLKLWRDTMHYFNHDIDKATPIVLRTDKYAVEMSQICDDAMIPVIGFYELNIAELAETFYCERLYSARALKILMQNAYRYFMLKPLDKLQAFFYDCTALSQQITVHKLIRTSDFHELPTIVRYIENNQGVVS